MQKTRTFRIASSPEAKKTLSPQGAWLSKNGAFVAWHPRTNSRRRSTRLQRTNPGDHHAPYGLWIRQFGSPEHHAMLSDWPLPSPRRWLQYINESARMFRMDEILSFMAIVGAICASTFYYPRKWLIGSLQPESGSRFMAFVHDIAVTSSNNHHLSLDWNIWHPRSSSSDCFVVFLGDVLSASF